VTAASEHAAPDRERAETYLRLQAEAELRRALAMPHYKPPRDPLPTRVTRMFVQARLMRRRRAATDRIMRQQASGRQSRRGSQSRAMPPMATTLREIRRAAKWLDGTRRAAAVPTAALVRSAARSSSQLSARVQRAARPLRRRFRRGLRHRGYDAPPAEACLTRVETLASVFAAVGAITTQTEEEVVDGLRAALAARRRIEPGNLLSYHGFRGHPMRRRATATTAPPGPPRAIPVGAAASGEIEGLPVRFYLGVLVFDHSGATLTVRARFPVELEEQDHGHMDPVFDALTAISAVDDRGATYRSDFSGGGGGGEWNGRLHLSPTPPPGVRWLDMTVPGASAVRVRLDATPRDLQITTEPVTTSSTERFLDAQTIQLLCREVTGLAWESDDDDRDEQPRFRVVSHLLAAGLLRTESPSLRRLATAAARLDTPLPGPLAAVEPSELPADWLSLLSRSNCTDGPTGAIPIAVVLPEVDGVQCVIVELVSDSESATIQVHVRGWPEPRQPFRVPSDQIWWSARDDLGGGYLVSEGGSSWGNGEADLDLEISPAINPVARVLDIILTGTTTQVTVSVPLDWQEGL